MPTEDRHARLQRAPQSPTASRHPHREPPSNRQARWRDPWTRLHSTASALERINYASGLERCHGAFYAQAQRQYLNALSLPGRVPAALRSSWECQISQAIKSTPPHLFPPSGGPQKPEPPLFSAYASCHQSLDPQPTWPEMRQWRATPTSLPLVMTPLGNTPPSHSLAPTTCSVNLTVLTSRRATSPSRTSRHEATILVSPAAA